MKNLLKLSLCLIPTLFLLLLSNSGCGSTDIRNSISDEPSIEASVTPNLAKIEEFTYLKLPGYFRNLKALYYNEKSRDYLHNIMRVKVSIKMSDLESCLSGLGKVGVLRPNPRFRLVTNTERKLSWWDPDTERDVLDGSFRKDLSTSENRKDWVAYVLVAPQDGDMATLYLIVMITNHPKPASSK